VPFPNLGRRARDGRHVRFTVDIGVTVYLFVPRSPWQRGSNENTNRLLRQYLPKGGDFRKRNHSGTDLLDARGEQRMQPSTNLPTG
jgi:hypothetical protein